MLMLFADSVFRQVYNSTHTHTHTHTQQFASIRWFTR